MLSSVALSAVPPGLPAGAFTTTPFLLIKK